MSERLAGRLAVITGGAAGIGRAIAYKLAKEGAHIAVADLNPADETRALVESHGRRFYSMQCDVSDEAQVNAFAASVRQEFGGVDIVVNNAAIALIADLEHTSFEQWRQLFSLNAGSCFLMAKAFVEDLKHSKAGRVISMSSSSYWESPPSFLAYVSTKGAINGFTHALATDLARYNITVNAIAPSVVRTPTTLRNLSEEFFEHHLQFQNLKRQQTPEDAANMVAYLADDEAAFITGQIFAVDGGLTRR
ncbi:SDR family oxidoreductase [Dyella sp. LX-66]|uniref:SDR family NAD(P)-dependent oxidoreductase n=1 Tax=unclassified Dyella TaxID=2634549 RepID=UPI001BDFAC97|nr:MULTISPECIES: SDR family oxidoreductase [unclassified Dyella]MBT2118933.1 SDR family oxidoreductase [Dyella sp. LX-1]MBT2140073.1 SDR family oxidoreductase [Dyella sp. LX-66]